MVVELGCPLEETKMAAHIFNRVKRDEDGETNLQVLWR